MERPELTADFADGRGSVRRPFRFSSSASIRDNLRHPRFLPARLLQTAKQLPNFQFQDVPERPYQQGLRQLPELAERDVELAVASDEGVETRSPF